jgi:pimeloyl-ACP methyl ester carboxylesterase
VPTLLIAGERDQVTLANNQQAAKRLSVESKLVTIQVGHSAGRSRKLDTVAEHAKRWFREHLN